MMSANIFNALLITAIGMSLVFSAILLLWGLMASLVHIAGLVKKRDEILEKTDDTSTIPGLTSQDPNFKQRLAVIAVSIAFARQAEQGEPQEFPLPPLALVSAWQAIMRSKMLSKRGTVR